MVRKIILSFSLLGLLGLSAYIVSAVLPNTDETTTHIPSFIRDELRAEADRLLINGQIIREQWAVYPYESYLALRGEALNDSAMIDPKRPVYLLLAETDIAGAWIYGGDGIGNHITAVLVAHHGTSIDTSVSIGYLPDTIPTLTEIPASLPRREFIAYPTGLPEGIAPEITKESPSP